MAVCLIGELVNYIHKIYNKNLTLINYKQKLETK